MTHRLIQRATARSALGLLAVALSAVPLLSPGPALAATISVAVENYDFAPATRTITAGDLVRWTFSGDPHSVTSRDGLFDSGVTDPGGSFQFRFTKAGTYRYYCVIHPGLMSGTIVVKAAAASTPIPTVQPTPTPTPVPTPKPTTRPTATPAPTPAPSTAPAGPSASPTPSALPSPSASAASSQALVATQEPSGGPPSAAPAPTEPAGTADTTPILAFVVVLAVVGGLAGLLVARRRRTV
jgi:plastocyanin